MRKYEIFGYVHGFFFSTCFIYLAVAKEVKNKNPYIKIYYEWEKIELDKNKVIYIRDEPITHIVDETFNIQKQKAIDPFWEDFIEQKLIEVNKRRERVI